MIELSSSAAIVVYLFLTVLTLITLWCYEICFPKKKVELASKQLLHCEYCSTLYLASNLSSLTRCPECKSLNKNNVFRKKK